MGGYSVSVSLPRVDVNLRAGQELALVVPVLDGDLVAVDPALIASARAQVRTGPQGGSLLYEFGEGTGAAVVAGGVRLAATAEQTAAWSLAWPLGVGWWDLEVTDTGGTPHQLTAPGRLAIARRITQ